MPTMLIRAARIDTTRDGSAQMSHGLVENQQRADDVRQTTLLNPGRRCVIECQVGSLSCERIRELLSDQPAVCLDAVLRRSRPRPGGFAAPRRERQVEEMGESDWMTVDVGSARNMDRRSIGVERFAWQARELPGLPTLNIGIGLQSAPEVLHPRDQLSLRLGSLQRGRVETPCRQTASALATGNGFHGANRSSPRVDSRPDRRRMVARAKYDSCSPAPHGCPRRSATDCRRVVSCSQATKHVSRLPAGVRSPGSLPSECHGVAVGSATAIRPRGQSRARPVREPAGRSRMRNASA